MDFDQFVCEIFNYDFRESFENENGYVEDDSGYIYVDGEEGDHGVVKYFLGKELVATRIIHGGDYEETNLTVFGKQIVADLFKKRIDEWSKE